jgi:hypothetical protein
MGAGIFVVDPGVAGARQILARSSYSAATDKKFSQCSLIDMV